MLAKGSGLIPDKPHPRDKGDKMKENLKIVGVIALSAVVFLSGFVSGSMSAKPRIEYIEVPVPAECDHQGHINYIIAEWMKCQDECIKLNKELAEKPKEIRIVVD